MASSNNKLTKSQIEDLLATLKQRFEKNTSRHKGLTWEFVEQKLVKAPSKLWSLFQMEESEGEPDVIVLNKKSSDVVFIDCSAESPKGRRSICYDRQALDSRKEHKPKDSALDMATDMGIEILTEDEYRQLQTFGSFDLKTSSWIETPAKIRKLGGALFCDHRFETTFTYHNGAESYYAARGFRGKITL